MGEHVVGEVRPEGAAGAERMAVAFATVLRRLGVTVPATSVVTFVEALGCVGIEERSGVYWAGRATLVQGREQRDLYDRAFAVVWLRAELIRTAGDHEPVLAALDDEREAGAADEADPAPAAVTLRYSPVEVLRHKDFATYSDDDFAQAKRLMAKARLNGPMRRSNRLAPTRRRTGRPDLRRTVRRSLRAHHEPIDQAFLDRAPRRRQVVILCDVSGSMEPYTRALLRFLHVAVSAGRQVEAFTMGTRLTRITRELSSHDPDAALAAATSAAVDRGGGTRLGEVMRRFNDGWGVRGMARGAVVVILSDGWDRGDPHELSQQMARLRRVAHRVVWVNPLKATTGYAPLARGMAAALPFVDEFVEGHSLASLEALAVVVARR